MCSISSAGCESTTTTKLFRNRKAGSTGSTSTACMLRSKPCLFISTKSIPEAAKRARQHYSCFEHFGKDITNYGYAGRPRPRAVLRRCGCQGAWSRSGAKKWIICSATARLRPTPIFAREQNAVVVRNAEEYYRNMFRREISSWNLRDTHMMESLVSLASISASAGTPAKIVVWAHNSHLGDARATQMGERGELNLGQLVREHFGKEAVSIGFTTYNWHGHRGVGLGCDPPNAKMSARLIAKVTKGSFMKSIRRAFFLQSSRRR